MSGERGAWAPGSVRALRRRLRASQQELARLIGVRQQTVSDWETGLHAPQGASRRLLDLLAGSPAAAPGEEIPTDSGAWPAKLPAAAPGEEAPARMAAERRAPYGSGAADEPRPGGEERGNSSSPKESPR